MFLKEVSYYQGCIYLIKIQKNSNILPFTMKYFYHLKLNDFFKIYIDCV